MSKGSQPTQQANTVIAEPSEFVKPYYEEALGQAQQLYQSDVPQYFPQATYTPFSGQTEAALQLQEQRALAGSPLLGSSQQEIQNILSGQYLNPATNPYLQQTFQRAAGDVQSQLGSMFAKGGRYGSAAMAETAGRTMGDIASQIYGSAYNQERARQLQAAQLAPQMAQQDYADIAQLAQVGQAREGLQEAALADAMQRFQFEQQKPYTKLREYLASIGAPYAQQTVSQQPIYRNLGANLLGGALGGAQLGSLAQLSPMGTLGAAGVGGLLGGFF
jgi:hypothetical protein